MIKLENLTRKKDVSRPYDILSIHLNFICLTFSNYEYYFESNIKNVQVINHIPRHDSRR